MSEAAKNLFVTIVLWANKDKSFSRRFFSSKGKEAENEGKVGEAVESASGDHFWCDLWKSKLQHFFFLSSFRQMLMTWHNIRIWLPESEDFMPFSFILHFHIVWKLLWMSHLNFFSFGIFYQFCPIKTDLSGNALWPQASGFQKLGKMDHFWHFLIIFCPVKM